MSAKDKEPEPVISNKAHDQLFQQMCQLWEYKYGSGPGCFCGSTGELIDTVDDLNRWAATHDPHPNYGQQQVGDSA